MLIGISRKQYNLEDKPFSSGGEGDVYRIIGSPNLVAKIYHPDRRTRELERKVIHMAKKPPDQSVLNQVAWPLDVIFNTKGDFYGFVMPKLKMTAELSKVYEYPSKTNITYKQKLILAQNICVVIHAVHNAGYVFGDFNPRNIGIDLQTGLVAFLDTDSYHIVIDREKNQAFRCNVCAPGYAAPELLNKCANHIQTHPEDASRAYAATPLDTFTNETDNFALAIHMFRLLMNGFTPFNGIKETETASVGSPGVGDAAVKRDSYCFKRGNKPQSAAVPSLETLPKEIQKLFTRAFIDGKSKPGKRPTASEWHKALEKYEKELINCSKNKTHQYKKGLKACPWCEADERYRSSIAPRPSMNQRVFATPVTTQVPQTPPVPPVSSYQQVNRNTQSYGQQSVSGQPIVFLGRSSQPVTGSISAGFSKPSKVRKPLLRPGAFKDLSSIVLNWIGWIAFLGSIFLTLRPMISEGSIHWNLSIILPYADHDALMIWAGIVLLIVGSSFRNKNNGLAAVLSFIWGAVVAVVWAMLKGGIVSGDVNLYQFYRLLALSSILLICTLIYGSKLGNCMRTGIWRKRVAYMRYGLKEIYLMLIAFGATGAFIWLLRDLSFFYRIITRYNLSLVALFGVPFVIFFLLGYGNKYGRGTARRGITCVTVVTFYTCYMLWCATRPKGSQLILWCVMAAVGIGLIWYLLENIGGSYAGWSSLFLVVEFFAGISPNTVVLRGSLAGLEQWSMYLVSFPPMILWVITMGNFLYEQIRK